MSEVVTDSPQIAANDLVMAKDMADALHQHYPGHLWAVAVQGAGLAGGFADVRNLALSGNWGFRIKLDSFYSASDFKRKVIMAGGEILERYRLHRGKFDRDKYSELPLDFAGRIKVDV